MNNLDTLDRLEHTVEKNKDPRRRTPLVPAKVAMQVSFECGCNAVWTAFGHMQGKGWVITPCKDHAEHRGEVSLAASEAFGMYTT